VDEQNCATKPLKINENQKNNLQSPREQESSQPTFFTFSQTCDLR
jgi:hypothetical protein